MDLPEGMVAVVRGMQDAALCVTVLEGNRQYTLMPNAGEILFIISNRSSYHVYNLSHDGTDGRCGSGYEMVVVAFVRHGFSWLPCVRSMNLRYCENQCCILYFTSTHPKTGTQQSQS